MSYIQLRAVYQQLHEELEAWVTKEGGGAREAALRIERACQNNLISLDLSSLELKTLPAAIGQLQHLYVLDLSSNQLTILPAEIGQLQHLYVLDLSLNQLTTLPAEIGQLLQLQILDLQSNRLTTIPAEIGRLLQLQALSLSLNQLTTLPAEISQLLQLDSLTFYGNPTLSEIPIAWSNLLNITNLDISGTSIPFEQLHLVLATIRRQRDVGAAERLPLKLNLWKDYAQIQGLNLDISVLTPEQKQLIYEWLVRLEGSGDFRLSQRSLCETACRMLNTVLKDGTFRETFFVQVRDNLVGCGDRAAMSFNEIYTAWVLATLPPDGAIHRKLEILTGVAKTNTLRSCLQQIIDSHERATGVQEQESVEVYLYYESTLQERLSLVSAIQNMLYATIGQREWIDVRNLTRQVMESYSDTLIEIPAFDALIKQDKPFMAHWASVDEPFQEQLGSLSEDVTVTSETYLTRTKEIQEARHLTWKTKAIQWAEAN